MDVEERDYVESEDEDYKPDTIAKDEDISASSDDEEGQSTVQAKKKSAPKRTHEQSVELDSGDEVTIKESRRRKRKKNKDEVSDHDAEDEGALVKTRAQRRAEKEERQERRRTDRGPVTIDVEEIWARLQAAPVGRPLIEELDAISSNVDQTAAPGTDTNGEDKQTEQPSEEAFITIKQTYEFAGQTVSEEKQVHRDSAEAKLYLSRHRDKSPDTPAPQLGENGSVIRRPLKRASMFEPNPTGEVKGLPAHRQRLRTPSRADVLALQKRLDEEAKVKGSKATRLNTVQKSKMDWATHVDAEGLKDELAEYDRSKQGYMGKMDFLQDVQGRRDQEERAARLQKA